MPKVVPSHTESIFIPGSFQNIVKSASECALRVEADGLVGSGHSGLLLIGAVQYVTGIPAFSIRREGEETRARGHNADSVCGVSYKKLERWLWLDDMVCSGQTLTRACFELQRYGFIGGGHSIDSLLPIGCFLYRESYRRTITANFLTGFNHLPEFQQPESYEIPVVNFNPDSFYV